MELQTAVDYFAQWVNYHKFNQTLTIQRLDELITNAKLIEKEQIIDAYSMGYGIGYDDAKFKKSESNEAEQYYNEVYGKDI